MTSYNMLLQHLSALPIDTLLLSGALGVFVLLLVFRSPPSRAGASPKTSLSSSSPEKPSAKPPPGTRVATIDPARLKEPNFGYDDVRVSKLLIHPIKSCQGISVQSARYTPEGLENDRLWCIVDAATNVAITAREFAKMVLIGTSIHTDENSPFGGVLNVSFPTGSECASFDVPLRPSDEVLASWQAIQVTLWRSTIDSRVCRAVSPAQDASAILSQYYGKPVHLVFKSRQPRNCDPTDLFPSLKATTVYQDGYPLLFLSEESMVVIENATRRQVGKQGVEDNWSTDRLLIERPNIIFSGGGPFAEDLWEEIAIGPRDAAESNAEKRFLVVSKCARCLLPNVNPQTAVRDKAVPYKVLMKMRIGIDPKQKYKPCVGCNGVPLGEGMVAVGDRVIVKRMLAGVGAP